MQVNSDVNEFHEKKQVDQIESEYFREWMRVKQVETAIEQG